MQTPTTIVLNEAVSRLLEAKSTLDHLEGFINGAADQTITLPSGKTLPSLQGLVDQTLTTVERCRAYIDNQNRELRLQLNELKKRVDELERR